MPEVEPDVSPPEVPNNKHRIIWTDSGIEDYRNLISQSLTTLQDNWDSPDTPVSFSILLQATNAALSSAAKKTNKSIDLSKEKKPSTAHVPLDVTLASKEKDSAHKVWMTLSEDPLASDLEKSTAKSQFKNARTNHRRLWRRHQASSANLNNDKLHDILTSNPQAAYTELRRHKSSSATKISELKVGDKTYQGEKVANGFYENMKRLKTLNDDTKSCPSCEQYKFDYNLIRELSKSGDTIPLLNIEEAEKLLYSLKPSVCDHYSISSLHYLHAGPLGIKHFQFLINSAIRNIENTTCDEFNTAHACVLYKGHQKDKSLANSYRTISTCPFLAKSLDFYIRELSSSEWIAAQADTQFLGENLSHELGALLLTETISHSLSDNLPVFCLFLDARSAFDLTIREIVIRKLHLIGTTGKKLLYLDNRLKHRRTFMEWDKKVLGPIYDELGFEQGGVSSSDLYKTYNNDQIQDAQESGLGIPLGDLEVAANAQADDVALLQYDKVSAIVII